MLPAPYPTGFVVGTTFHETWTFSNPDGSPVNWTGYGAVWQVRNADGSVAKSISTTATADGVILLGSDGTVQPILTDAATTALGPGTFAHDFLTTSPGSPPTGAIVDAWMSGPLEGRLL